MGDPEFSRRLQLIQSEAKAYSVQDVIDQLTALPDVVKQRMFSLWDDEEGDAPYYGELRVHEQMVTMTPDWTKEMHAQMIAARKASEAQSWRDSWNRPEVLDAKEKGLLP
jgi:hypothetical protein